MEAWLMLLKIIHSWYRSDDKSKKDINECKNHKTILQYVNTVIYTDLNLEGSTNTYIKLSKMSSTMY
jgi:glucan phosphoethanolaminetransferase (alkaline phosphatase superfamily)